MKTIKQSTNGSCNAAVAAMVCGCTEQEVFDFLGRDGTDTGISDYDINRFYALKGYLIGLVERKYCGPSHKINYYLDGGGFFDFKMSEAWLSVVSHNYKDTMHSVFWDGKMIRDPDPRKPDLMPLNAYEVKEIYPVMHRFRKQEYVKHKAELK